MGPRATLTKTRAKAAAPAGRALGAVRPFEEAGEKAAASHESPEGPTFSFANLAIHPKLAVAQPGEADAAQTGDPASPDGTAPPAHGQPTALSGMERAFGASFSDVTLRADGQAAAQASSLGVLAYTDGREIGFARGRWRPDTREGRRTLAHELAHVVQARGGSGGSLSPSLVVADASISTRSRESDGREADAIEADAEAAAEAVDRGARPRVAAARWSGLVGQEPPKPSPETPPADSFKLKQDSDGDYAFTVRGSVIKGWGRGSAREAFKAYVKLAFPAASDDIASACADDAKLWWDKDPDPSIKDNEAITITIHAGPRSQATGWMKRNHPEIQEVKPNAGTYKIHLGKGGGKSGGQQQEGTADGESLRQFEPEGEVLFQPELHRFVVGADINALFRFTGDEEGKLYNFYPFTRRVDFDWTITKGIKVVDTGPLLESGGDNEYTFSVSEASSFVVSVTAKSRYFKGGKTITRSHPFEAVKEETQREDAMKEGFVGPEADKPFEVGADGKPVVKTGAKASGAAIQEQLKQLSLELGAIETSKTIPADKLAEYVKYYQGRIDALKGIQAKVGKQDYVAGGVFVSREDGQTSTLRTAVSGRRGGVDDGKALYAVGAYDVTFSNEAIQHSGTASAPATPDEAAGYAAAEEKAIDAMANDWHWYNDFPNGTIQLTVGLREGSGGKTKTVVIDTNNPKKPAKKILAGVAIAGSVALTALSGGTAAPLLVLTLEVATAAAAVALTADNIVTRINNGTFRLDSKLVLDMLALVPIAGSLARVAGVLAGRGLLLLSLSVAGASAVLIAEDTRKAIRETDASYAGKIEAASTPEEKERLGKERDLVIARILGAAAASEGLILVMAAVGAKKGLSEPRPTGEVLPSDAAPAAKQAEVTPAPAAKQAEVTPAPAAKQAEVTPAPAAKQAEVTPAPAAKQAEVTPAPAAKQAEVTPAPAAKQAEVTPAPAAKQAEVTPAPAAKQAEVTPAPAAKQAEVTPAPAAKQAEVTPAPAKAGATEPTATAPAAASAETPVPKTGPNWGIPEGGVPIKVRAAQKGVKLPDWVEKNPDLCYYDPKGKYHYRIGFPMEEGVGVTIPCFPAGTLVAIPGGSCAIDRIQRGDEVLAYQEHTREVIARRVLATHESSAAWLYRVDTAEGAVLATGDHLFWVGPGEYRAARDLAPRVELRCVDGKPRRIVSVETIHAGQQPTYNLTVDADFTYFVGADGLLVHNEGPYSIYIGRDPLTQLIVYVGQTLQKLVKRQGDHQADARAEPERYAGKTDVELEYARGPDGKLLTNLSEDEANWWERKIYDREVAAGAKLANRQVPYVDEKMALLFKKYCAK